VTGPAPDVPAPDVPVAGSETGDPRHNVPVTELALVEAVALAHAMVDRVARDHDVRVLFIKGPAATAQRLRAARISVDVDLLVDPLRRSVLAEALGELTWVDEHPYTSPTVLPMHSLAFRSPRWSCELDLHDRFPGFFAEPQAMFETLWDRHVVADVAARDIPCPDLAAHSLFLALNSLRDPHHSTKAAELDFLVSRVRGIFDEHDLEDLARLASELGAADTCAPFLLAVGAPEVGRGTTSHDDLRSWHLLTDPEDGTAVSWVEELRKLPKRQWPRYLWYAAWLSEVELRLADPTLKRGWWAVTGARLRRLRRGVRALPAAVRSVRRTGG
jgi:hypothetical protein